MKNEPIWMGWIIVAGALGAAFGCDPCDDGFHQVRDKCLDINECLDNNGGCDPVAPCINSKGSFACGPCPEGYTGHGDTGCYDIDECAINTASCDPLTECTNTPGSWECSPCPAGHAGDGRTGCYLGVNLIAKNIYYDTELSCGIHLDWEDALDVGGQNVAAYAIYRDGSLVASTSFSLFEDIEAEGGAHIYTVKTVNQDGVESVASNEVTITNENCNPSLSKNDFVVQGLEAYPLSYECRSTQLHVTLPHAQPSYFGYQYYINGEFRNGKYPPACSSDGIGCGQGGIDALVPGFDYVYAVAPLFGENGERIGPLIAAPTFAMPYCTELPHLPTLAVDYILVRFGEFSDDPFDHDYAMGVATDYPYSIRDYFETISYGRQTTSTRIFGWYALPGTADDYCEEMYEVDGRQLGFSPTCDFPRVVADARQLAAELDGFDDKFRRERRVVVAVQGVSKGAYNIGYAGVFVSPDYFVTAVISHELGHSIYLEHAGMWTCRVQDHSVGPSVRHPREGECGLGSYGPVHDLMAIYLRHFNSHHKLLAGYLDGTNIQTVTASGEYTLRALEVPDANGVFQLRIPLYGDTFYFLEYRIPRDYDSNETFPVYATAAPFQDRPWMKEGIAIWFQYTRFMFEADTFAVMTPTPPSVPIEQIMVTKDNDFYDPYRRIRIKLIEFLPDDYARVSIAYDSD